MVAAVSKSWVRVGWEGSRPLAEIWAERTRRLEQVAPPHHPSRSALLLRMCDENLHQIDEAIHRAEHDRAAAAQPIGWEDPLWKAARDERQTLRQRFHRAWCQKRELRSKLHPNALVHHILGDLPRGWNHDSPGIFRHDENDPPCRTHNEERQRIQEFLPRVLEEEACATAMNEAVQNESCADRVLVEALYRHFLKLEHQFDAIRQDLRDLKQQPKPRKK